MKKSDITKIFADATEEQINSLLNLHKSELGQVQTQLDDANQKLTGFDGVDVNGLNTKITDYEQQITALQTQLTAEKVSSAVRFGLLQAKAVDTDYLTYKLTESMKADGKNVELDDSGNVKDWDTILQGLKTKFPAQFEGDSAKRIEEHKLPEGDKDAKAEPATLTDALHDFYEPNNSQMKG